MNLKQNINGPAGIAIAVVLLGAFCIFLYTKFYDWWWDWMPKYIFFLVMGLAAVLLLVVFKRLRGVAA